MIKAVIFDLDGVLIDSVALGLRARKKLLASYGVDLNTIPDPQGESHKASSLKTLLAHVKARYNIDIDHDEFAQKAREQIYQELQESGTSADPLLVSFLDNLTHNHIMCAIASSGLRAGINNKLKILGIAHYFSVIVSGDEVKEHKPHPEPYLYAMQKLNLSPHECVIFEDSLTGVQAGLAAGCAVIGFTQYNAAHDLLPATLPTIRNWGEIDYEKLNTLA